MSKEISRRNFLKVIGGSMAGLVLTACGAGEPVAAPAVSLEPKPSPLPEPPSAFPSEELSREELNKKYNLDLGTIDFPLGSGLFLKIKFSTKLPDKEEISRCRDGGLIYKLIMQDLDGTNKLGFWMYDGCNDGPSVVPKREGKRIKIDLADDVFVDLPFDPITEEPIGEKPAEENLNNFYWL